MIIQQKGGHGLRAYTSSVGCADTFPSKGKAMLRGGVRSIQALLLYLQSLINIPVSHIAWAWHTFR